MMLFILNTFLNNAIGEKQQIGESLLRLLIVILNFLIIIYIICFKVTFNINVFILKRIVRIAQCTSMQGHKCACSTHLYCIAIRLL